MVVARFSACKGDEIGEGGREVSDDVNEQKS